MIVYYIVFGLFSVNTFFNKSKHFKYINLIIFTFFIMVYSLRKKVGTDWVSYKYYFDNSFSPDLIRSFKFEFGYKLLNHIARLFFSSYWDLVFIVGIFIGILFWKGTNKLSSNIGLVMLLSLYYLFYPSLESFRQSLTVFLFYYSLDYIEKDRKKYFLLNFIGFLFHRTGAFAFLFYFFNKSNKNRLLITVGMILFSFLPTVFLPLINKFPVISEKYYYYFVQKTGQTSLITLKLIEYFLILLVYSILAKRKALNIQEKLIFNLILLGFILQVSIGQISSIVYRTTFYTDIGIMLGYVYFYDRIKGYFFKYVYIIFLIFYVFIRFLEVFPFRDSNFLYHF